MATTEGQEVENFLAQNIRFLRKKMNWSQEELALRIGLNRGNIASYENGTAEPKICNLFKLAQLFKVPILHLAQEDLSKVQDSGQGLSVPGAGGFNPVNGLSICLKDSRAQAQEIRELIKSLATCGRYRIRNFSEELPREIQVLVVNFEELFSAAETIAEKYLHLIDCLDGQVQGHGMHPKA